MDSLFVARHSGDAAIALAFARVRSQVETLIARLDAADQRIETLERRVLELTGAPAEPEAAK